MAVDAKKHSKKHSVAVSNINNELKPDNSPIASHIDHTQQHNKFPKGTHHKHPKKSKRSAYARSWSSKEYTFMPPYLVFNRKTGAYYPYYTQHGNNIRRNAVKSSRQGLYGA